MVEIQFPHTGNLQESGWIYHILEGKILKQITTWIALKINNNNKSLDEVSIKDRTEGVWVRRWHSLSKASTREKGKKKSTNISYSFIVIFDFYQIRNGFFFFFRLWVGHVRPPETPLAAAVTPLRISSRRGLATPCMVSAQVTPAQEQRLQLGWSDSLWLLLLCWLRHSALPSCSMAYQGCLCLYIMSTETP